MPMFEDSPGLAHDGERLRKDVALPRPATPADHIPVSSQPISIPAAAPASSPYHARRMSEESIRTELCEGPVSNSLSPLHRSFASRRPSSASDEPHSLPEPRAQEPPWTPSSRDSSGPITDRAELIERIKRGESPTWVPNRHVSDASSPRDERAVSGRLVTRQRQTPPLLNLAQLESLFRAENSTSPTRNSRPPSAGTPTSTALLPAPNITPERIPLEAHDHDAEFSARLDDGMNIERPRSALHSGDFTETIPTTKPQGRPPDETAPRGSVASSARTPAPGVSGAPFRADASALWVATSPPRHYTPFSSGHRETPASSLAELGVFRSTMPSPSSSLSSSFVYKPPTSPLVQSQSNDGDDDTADITLPMNNIDIALGNSPSNTSDNVRPGSRRHTLTFSHIHHVQPPPYAAPFSPHTQSRYAPGASRRESYFPYQAHQPRRSMSTTSGLNAERSAFHSASTPQTPLLPRSKRASFTSDTSPLQHASMVGSYEESILRGRMSTTPSKPLDFLAQIGVLGLGARCKPSLRCPSHVTLPFSAVFYSYATTPHGRSKAEDGPSPYVGMVDLENGLPNTGAEQRSKRKAMLPGRRAPSNTRAGQRMDDETTAGPTGDVQRPGRRPDEATLSGNGSDVVMDDVDAMQPADPSQPDTEEERPSSKASPCHRRRPHGPKAPPGGSYRIPQQGQLQIIIKNQNKTAVKLFLVPYDLTGMEPGTKTFIRQRSYSAGPIIDNMPSVADSAADRPILRYLIHLHICCPSRGRYYLYKSIRVVFANRVPDGKEKLRNELTFPEPRFSPYKPIRVMHPPAGIAGGSGYRLGDGSVAGGVPGAGSHGAALTAERAYRRRSSGYSFTSHSAAQTFDAFGIQHHVPPLPAVPLMARPLPLPWPPWPNQAPSGAASSSSHAAEGDRTAIVALPRSSPTSPDSLSAGHVPGQQPAMGGSVAPGHRQGGSLASGRIAANVAESSRSAAMALPELPLYKKLSKGDIGYGGNAFVSGSPASYDGLLSQRLRSLEAERKPATGADDSVQRPSPHP